MFIVVVLKEQSLDLHQPAVLVHGNLLKKGFVTLLGIQSVLLLLWHSLAEQYLGPATAAAESMRCESSLPGAVG